MKIKSIVRRFDANSADKKKQEVERRYLAVFSISDHSCFSILMLEKKITSTRCAPIFLDSLSLRRIVRRTVDRLDRKVVGIDIEIGTNGVEVLKKKQVFESMLAGKKECFAWKITRRSKIVVVRLELQQLHVSQGPCKLYLWSSILYERSV